MRQHFAILFVSIALAAMSALGCLPHHHHGGEVCFGVDITEHCNHCEAHNHDADHTHSSEECGNAATAGDDDCSLTDIFHKLLPATEPRADMPMVEVVLPTWIGTMGDDCNDYMGDGRTLGAHSPHRPILYESPLLGTRALRAPPVA